MMFFPMMFCELKDCGGGRDGPVLKFFWRGLDSGRVGVVLVVEVIGASLIARRREGVVRRQTSALEYRLP